LTFIYPNLLIIWKKTYEKKFNQIYFYNKFIAVVYFVCIKKYYFFLFLHLYVIIYNIENFYSIHFKLIVVENYLFKLISYNFSIFFFNMVFLHNKMFDAFEPKFENIFFSACVLIYYERQIECRKNIILAIIIIYE